MQISHRARWFSAGVTVTLAAAATAVVGLSSDGPTAATASTEPTPIVSLLRSLPDTPAAGRLSELSESLSHAPFRPVTGSIRNVRLDNGADVSVFRSTDNRYCLTVTTPAPERGSTSGCGTLEDIALGRFSVADRDPGTNGGYLVAGIAPDGVRAVKLAAASGGTASSRAAVEGASLAVEDNVFGTIVPAKPEALSWTTGSGEVMNKSFPK